jgi:C1A family cysteine protease
MKYSCLLTKDAPNEVLDIDSKVKTLPPLSAASIKKHIINESTPIGNQFQVASCVANATCDAFEILMGLEGKTVEQLSRLFVYWNARIPTHTTKKDNGSFISLAMLGLVDYGVCRESTWEYDTDKVFHQPSILAYKEADDNRAKNFYKIRSSGERLLTDVSSAVKLNMPVVFGVPVGNEFESYSGEGILNEPSVSLGNHALIIVGVDEEEEKFLIRNSWGSTWGDGGHAWFSYRYIERAAEDLHVLTGMAELI